MLESPWTEAELDSALEALGAERDDATGNLSLSTAATALAEALPFTLPVPAAQPERRTRYLRVAVSGGIAAAVAGVLLLVPSTKDSGVPATSSQTVVALRSAADVTIHQRDVPLRPGQFRYIADHAYVVPRAGSEHPLAWSYYLTTRTWVPYDQQQPWTQDYRSTGPVHWLVGDAAEGRRQGITDPLHAFGPDDGRTTARCGDFMHVGPTQGPCVDATNGKQVTTYSLSGLPRDPNALLPVLRGGSGDGSVDDGPPPLSAAGVLNRASMLLGSGLVPADLRAAIYRALAMMPELRITDRFANLDGRVGIAYGVTDRMGDVREDIVIDPRTGQFIGMRQVLTSDDPSMRLRAGTVINYSALTTSVVNAVPPR
jgi:hypothetical protein